MLEGERWYRGDRQEKRGVERVVNGGIRARQAQQTRQEDMREGGRHRRRSDDDQGT
jgi:hypothetical protein